MDPTDELLREAERRLSETSALWTEKKAELEAARAARGVTSIQPVQRAVPPAVQVTSIEPVQRDEPQAVQVTSIKPVQAVQAALPAPTALQQMQMVQTSTAQPVINAVSALWNGVPPPRPDAGSWFSMYNVGVDSCNPYACICCCCTVGETAEWATDGAMPCPVAGVIAYFCCPCSVCYWRGKIETKIWTFHKNRGGVLFIALTLASPWVRFLDPFVCAWGARICHTSTALALMVASTPCTHTAPSLSNNESCPSLCSRGQTGRRRR